MTFAAWPMPTTPIDLQVLAMVLDQPQHPTYKDAVAVYAYRMMISRTEARIQLPAHLCREGVAIFQPELDALHSAALERKRQRATARKLNNNMRTAVGACLSGTKNRRRTFDVLGYSLSDLRDHLEAQFIDGMTWENYGPLWHVDHRRPLASFQITGPDCLQFKAAWALSNLQPLWAIDNLRKGAKWNPGVSA